jgi:hypothetical protein
MCAVLPLPKKAKKRPDGIDSLEQVERIWLLLLGYTKNSTAIPLLTQEDGNKTFRRIGQICVPKAEEKNVWLHDMNRRVVTML